VFDNAGYGLPVDEKSDILFELTAKDCDSFEWEVTCFEQLFLCCASQSIASAPGTQLLAQIGTGAI
jgi:hypothetical protein